MTIQVKINTSSQTLETIQIPTNNVVTIQQPSEKVSFELIDLDTGLAPQSIVAKRVGANLEIAFDDAEEATLVIKGYYDNEELSPFVGLAEDGQYYTYIPTSGVSTDSIPELSDNVLAVEVLGGKVSSPIPFFAAWPWLVGGLVAAILDAAVSSNHKGQPKPLDVNVGNSGDNDDSKDGDKDELARAKADVEEAKKADKAAKDALAKANEDGVITPEEKAKLEELKADAQAKKDQAQKSVDDLPDSMPEKPELNDVLKGLDNIHIPTVTDADSDGKRDTDELAKAKADVEEAKKADKAAKDALAKANEDGKITPEEKAELDKLKADADAKKDKAQKSVDDLPSMPEKPGLNNVLSGLDNIQVPEVNDADSDGKLDSNELAKAKADVEEAKKADQAAKDALEEARKDGVITPEEKADLEAKKADAEAKKDQAQKSVDDLPVSMPEKPVLNDVLKGLDNIKIPNANDIDADGKLDSDELAKAKADVEEAKKADKAAKDALAKANEDGLITPAEKAELERLKAEAEAKKDQAQKSVDDLPNSMPEKATLNDELAQLDGIEVPDVNNADSDNKLDADELAQAQADVEAAKQADKAAKDALEKANADGLITPEEKAELDKLKADADAKKEKAQQSVDELPESMPEKAGLNDELDKLDGIVVPDVNDLDRDGKLDQEEIEEAVVANDDVFDANEKLKEALKEAQKDGVTPEEKENLDNLKADIDAKKEKAQDIIDNLPDVPEKPELNDDLKKLDYPDVPPVTPQTGKPVAPTSYNDNQPTIVDPNSTAPTTDDRTPGLNIGTGKSNPKLYVDGVFTPSTYENGQLTPITPLEEREEPYKFAYTETDLGHRESELSDALPITIDRTAPTAPILTPENGAMKVTLPEDAKAGDKVVLTVPQDNGEPKEVEFTKQPEGSDKPWAVTKGNDVVPEVNGNEAIIPADKVSNTQNVTGYSEDPAGNHNDAIPQAAGSLPQTARPDRPTDYKDDVGTKVNNNSTEPTTDDQTPGLNIGEGKKNPKLYVDGRLVPSTYENGVLTPTEPLPEKEEPYNFAYTETEDGKRESPLSEPLPIEIDRTAPTAPVLTPENGAIKVGLPADAKAGDKVVLNVPQEQGEPKEVEFTKQPDGTWAVTKGNDVVPEVNGNEATIPADKVSDTENVTGRSEDPAGNTANAVPTNAGTLPPTAKPSKPTSYKDDVEPKSKNDSTDPTTNDDTPGLNIGRGKQNPKLYVDGVEVPSTYDEATGVLTPTQPLAEKEAPYNLAYTETAPGKTESPLSDPLPITVDKTAPAAPVLTPENGAVKVDLPEDAKAGDKVVLSVPQEQGAPKEVEFTKKPDGTWAVTKGNDVVPAVNGNEATIPADKVSDTAPVTGRSEDPAGNTNNATPQAAGSVPQTAKPVDPTSYEDNKEPAVNPNSSEPLTNDNTPGLNIGTGNGDKQPKLYVDGQPVDATYNPTTGTLTPTQPLADGPHKLTYTLTEPGKTESPQSEALDLVIDTTAPKKPELEAGKPEAGAILVTLPDDAKDGDLVELTIPKQAPAQGEEPYATVVLVKQPQGWVVDPNRTTDPNAIELKNDGTAVIPADKVHDARPVNAVSKDPMGNESEPETAVAGRPNQSAQPEPATSYKDDVEPVANAQSTDPVTNDTTPGLNIGEGKPNPKLYVDGQEVPSTYENGVLTPTTPLAPRDEPYNLTYTVTEPNKEESPQSNPLELTIDNTAPTKPTLTAGQPHAGALTVGLPEDAKAGDTVELMVPPQDGGQPAKVVLTKTPEGWKVTEGDPTIVKPTAGTNTAVIPADKVSDTIPVTAVSKDPAGNTSEPAEKAAGGLDKSQTPRLESYKDDQGSVTNPANGDNTKSDDKTPSLNIGTGKSNPKLYVDGQPVEATYDAQLGTLTPKQPLAGGDKPYVFTYTVTEPNKTESDQSNPLTMILDTTAPAAPVLTKGQPYSGAVKVALPTNAENDDTVEIMVPPQNNSEQPVKVVLTKKPNGWEVTEGEGVLTVDGNNATIPADKVSDTRPVTAVSKDPVGNTAQATPVTAGAIARTAKPTLTTFKDDEGSVQNPANPTNTKTDDDKPSLNIGTGKANANPKLYVDGKPVDATYNPADGTLTPVNPIGTADKPYKLSYTLTEPNKSESPRSNELNVILDKTAPTPVTFEENQPYAGALRATLPANAEKDDTVTLTIPAEGTGEPQVVELTKQKDGSWRVTSDPKGVGLNPQGNTVVIPADKVKDGGTVTAVAKDPVGNSAESEGSVGGLARSATPTLQTYRDDQGDVRSQGYGNQTRTDDRTPSLNIGRGKSNPKLYVDGNLVESRYDEQAGTLTPVNPISGPDKTYGLSYTVTEPNKLESARSNTINMILDTTAPSPVTYEPNQPYQGALTVNLPRDAANGDSVELSIPAEGTNAPQKVVLSKQGNNWVVTQGQNVGVTLQGSKVIIPHDKVADNQPVVAISKDPVGNAGQPTEGRVGSIAQTAKPSLQNYKDNEGSVTNNNYGNNTRTDDKTPSLNIGGNKSNPKLYVDGQLVESDYDSRAGTLTPRQPLAGGDKTYSLSYTLTDPNKSESPQSNAINMILDTRAPSKPTFAPNQPYQGALKVNLPTDAENGDFVELNIPANNNANQKVVLTKQNGSWVVTSGQGTVLAPEGNSVVIPHDKVKDNARVTAVSKDPVGNSSEVSQGQVGAIAQSDKPSFESYRDNQGSVTNNAYTNNSRTDDKTPSLNIGRGKSNPKLYVDGKHVAATYNEAEGTLTPNQPLNNGDKNYALSYTVTDPNKSESPRSNVVNMTLDTTAPTPPTFTANQPYKGALTVGLPTNAQAGDSVVLTVPGEDNRSHEVELVKQSNGSWRVTKGAGVVEAPNGNTVVIPHDKVKDNTNVTGYSKDPVGNQSSTATGQVGAIDRTAKPNTPTSYKDDVAPVVENARTQAPTNDDRPGLNIGTGHGNKQPKLYVDGREVPADYNATEGTLTPRTPLSAGEHRLTYTLTEPNKAESPQSEPVRVEIDKTAPAAPVLTANPDGSVTVQLPTQNVKPGDKVIVNVVKTGETNPTPVELTKTADGWSVPQDKQGIIPTPVNNVTTIPAPAVKDASQVTARAEDPAGNVADAQPVTAASERVLEKLTLRLQDDTQGVLTYATRDRLGRPSTASRTVGSKTDKITSNDKVIVEKVPAGMDWQYSLDGGNTWTDMRAGTNSFNLIQNGEKPNGKRYNVLARVKDAPSSQSEQLGVTIDKVKPAVSAYLDPAANAGRGGFKGTAEPGTFVVMKIGDRTSRTVVGTAVADSNGNFTINPSSGRGQPELSKAGTYTVEAIDKAGNKGYETFKSSYLELKSAYQGVASSNNNQSALDQINNNNGGNDYIHIHEGNNAPEPTGLFTTGDPKGAIWGQLQNGPRIDTGNGDDYLYVQKSIRQFATIDMGSGDDTLEVGDSIRRIGLGDNHRISIDMGSGDDTVIVRGIVGREDGSGTVADASIYGGVNLEMGDGNDHLQLKGGITNLANVRGGNGFDTISMIDSGGKLIAQTNSIFGWEKIDLTGKGSNTLAFEGGTNGIISFVQKNGGTVQDDNGRVHNNVLIITGNGDDRIENFNHIQQSGTVQYDGERYKVFSGIGGTHQLWIDYDIQIV